MTSSEEKKNYEKMSLSADVVESQLPAILIEGKIPPNSCQRRLFYVTKSFIKYSKTVLYFESAERFKIVDFQISNIVAHKCPKILHSHILIVFNHRLRHILLLTQQYVPRSHKTSLEIYEEPLSG